MRELGYYQQAVFCIDGAKAIEVAKEMLAKALETADRLKLEKVRPVSVLLLDF